MEIINTTNVKLMDFYISGKSKIAHHRKVNRLSHIHFFIWWERINDLHSKITTRIGIN